MLPIALILSVVMGVVLGLLGGGGSILTVPILVYALGLEAKGAIATSLLVVGLTAFAGVAQHARAGNVRWRTGLLFGTFAMVGAYGGGRLAKFFSGELLLVLFAGLMIATGLAMLRKRERPDETNSDALPASDTPPEPMRPLQVAKVGAEGLVVGGVTGLVGAGGGFLVVPALVLLGGVPMKEAIGTSLLVIGLKSMTGLVGHLAHEQIDWVLALTVTGAAIAGTFVGSALARRIDARKLRKGFAIFVLVMAAWMIRDNMPPSWAEAIGHLGTLSLVLGLGAAVLGLGAASLLLRPSRSSSS